MVRVVVEQLGRYARSAPSRRAAAGNHARFAQQDHPAQRGATVSLTQNGIRQQHETAANGPGRARIFAIVHAIGNASSSVQAVATTDITRGAPRKVCQYSGSSKKVRYCDQAGPSYTRGANGARAKESTPEARGAAARSGRPATAAPAASSSREREARRACLCAFGGRGVHRSRLRQGGQRFAARVSTTAAQSPRCACRNRRMPVGYQGESSRSRSQRQSVRYCGSSNPAGNGPNAPAEDERSRYRRRSAGPIAPSAARGVG